MNKQIAFILNLEFVIIIIKSVILIIIINIINLYLRNIRLFKINQYYSSLTTASKQQVGTYYTFYNTFLFIEIPKHFSTREFPSSRPPGSCFMHYCLKSKENLLFPSIYTSGPPRLRSPCCSLRSTVLILPTTRDLMQKNLIVLNSQLTR